MADKTTTLKNQAGDNIYPNIVGDNRNAAIKDSATIKHTLAENKISLDLDETIKGKIDAALQKPTGLTKTKLVGVGTSGQENIEIGDNLTLANGKLSAMGGGSNANILVGSAPEQSDDGYTGTYSGVPDNSKINILRIDGMGDFVITLLSNDVYFGYVSTGDVKFTIILSEGEYILKSESSGVAFDTIVLSNDDTTYTGTITGERPLLIKSSGTTILPVQNYQKDLAFAFAYELGDGDAVYLNFYFLGDGQVQNAKILIGARYYSHFITMTNSTDNVSLCFTIQNANEAKFDSNTLASYLAGKKVLANGNLHGAVPTYIAGEGGVIKIYYRTPGDSNINPTPDEYQDLYSFSISELVTPVE